MKLDQHDVSTITHEVIRVVEKRMGDMPPETMIAIREVIENHEYIHLPCYIKGCVNGPENHQWNDECQKRRG